MLLPLVLTAACLATLAGTAVVATGSTLPAVSLQQSGHWALDQAAAAVFHIHGGTQKVDARVALPADAAQAGFLALQGEKDGYVVGSQRAWAFDKSTLAVDETVALPPAEERPIGVEVVGGPYLVYRDKGTVVRLGRPPVVLDAGGPVGMPVRTTDGTVWVHRPDTGELCAVRRGATEIDCTLAVEGGTPGGLTVTTDRATFVDTRVDAAQQIRGTRLSAGAGLSSDLPSNTLLADQDASARLPVLLTNPNILRLLDSTGIPTDRVAADPLDIDLGPGTFTAPLVSGEIVAVIELTTSRLLTFSASGGRISDVQLAPGTGQDALVRGEDGRLYVNDAGGGQVRIVRPDGTIGSVGLGGGTGPGIATAPPTEQLQEVVAPPVGRRPVPIPSEDVRAAAPDLGQALPAGPPITLPGGTGPEVTIPGDTGTPPGVAFPNPGDPLPPGPVPPVLPEPEPILLPPGVPTGVTAELSGPTGVTVSWTPGPGGEPTDYTVTGSGAGGTKTATATTVTFTGLVPDTYTFTVVAENAAGASTRSAPSAAVTIAAAGLGPVTNLTAERKVGSSAVGYLAVTWTPPEGPVDHYRIGAAAVLSGQPGGVQAVITEPEYNDNRNYCATEIAYTVVAVGPDDVDGEMTTIELGPGPGCTPTTVVDSATPNPDGSVTVVVDCQILGRSPETNSPIVLLFNGEVVDNGSQTCRHTGGGHDPHTFRITGLDAATTYQVRSRTTSPSGDKTSAPVSVTTP